MSVERERQRSDDGKLADILSFDWIGAMFGGGGGATHHRTWTDEATGLLCAIYQSPYSLNGYVLVPKDHPYWGKTNWDDSPVAVHGGLTYAEATGPNEDDYEGRWWFGWDTNHAGDEARGWDDDLVAEECEYLAGQLVADDLPEWPDPPPPPDPSTLPVWMRPWPDRAEGFAQMQHPRFKANRFDVEARSGVVCYRIGGRVSGEINV